MSTSLEAETRRLGDSFHINTNKLKSITDHFVNELAKGMLQQRSR